MRFLIDLPDGTCVENDSDSVSEARKQAFNLLLCNRGDRRMFSARVSRMTSKGPVPMGHVGLDGMWTRSEPPDGSRLFTRMEAEFVGWRPITRRSTVICGAEDIMFDADLFTPEGIRCWFLRNTPLIDIACTGLERIRMMPSFDCNGGSCWVSGDGPRSCTFWRMPIPEGCRA